MPYTLNGFGTKYYGKRDPGQDGSYITTMWITALYVPIVPLGSYRVLPVGDGTNWGVHRSQNFRVLRQPLCWEQVWRIYMIAAPILLIVGGFVWTGIKKDRAKDAIHAQMKAAGTEIDAAQTETEKLETSCMQLLKSAKTNGTQDVEALRESLHDQCAPMLPAIDAYVAKVDGMQKVIGQGLSNKELDANEHNSLSTFQTIFNVRRHQADETRQIAVCLQDVTHECYAGVKPLIAAMDKEDQQVCSLLAAVNQKCEQ